jgi:hypothetical protein
VQCSSVGCVQCGSVVCRVSCSVVMLNCNVVVLVFTVEVWCCSVVCSVNLPPKLDFYRRCQVLLLR